VSYKERQCQSCGKYPDILLPIKILQETPFGVEMATRYWCPECFKKGLGLGTSRTDSRPDCWGEYGDKIGDAEGRAECARCKHIASCAMKWNGYDVD